MRAHISKKIRDSVKAKFGGRCAYCGVIPPKLQIDHLIPIARVHMHKDIDPNGVENLMPACSSCNNYKITYSLEQFRTQISQQLNRCRQYSVNFRIAERFGLVQEISSPVVFYFEKAAK